jgi:sec-independent protein translocase protein TatC
MADNFDDDLFAHTKMTFGEHLDELRASLFKAVFALAIGFGIGLLFANSIVRMIESPLTRALENYYIQGDADKVMQKLAEREKKGEIIPEALKTREAVEEIVVKQKLLFEEHFVNVDELLQELKLQKPELFAHIEPAGEKKPEVATTNGSAGKAPDGGESGSAEAADPEKSKNGAAAAATTAPLAPRMMRIYLWHKVEDDGRIDPQSTGVQETFMIYIKAAFIAGAVISSPFVFYFLWSFVAAGLFPHEKRYIHVFLPASIGLFVAGALLAFFFVFDPVLQFLFSFNRSLGINPDPRIGEWMSFVLMLPLGFGISFQLPLVMLFLERIGIFTVSAYMSKWRIAVLAIAILSMVLSPGGDPYSMMMMFVPLTILYFGGVAACYYLPGPGRAERMRN